MASAGQDLLGEHYEKGHLTYEELVVLDLCYLRTAE